MNRSEKIKRRLFSIYADSALRSGYSKEKAYFCPLCVTQHHESAGLTVDHVPAKALGLPTVKVLTCSKKCNSDSGIAQERLCQAHLFHMLTHTHGPTAPHPVRLTLGKEKVNARVWKDQEGTIQVALDTKHNKPGSVEAFREAYEKANESSQIQLSTIVALDQPLIRWALVREAYLLLFYHWGYWLLRETWAKKVQELLDNRDTPLHRGSVIQTPSIPYTVSPVQGQFLNAKMPSGQSCWLIPVIDDRCAVFPSDNQEQECTLLWEEMASLVDSRGPLKCCKVVIGRDVKNSSEWAVVKREDSNHTPSYWIEIAPIGK